MENRCNRLSAPENETECYRYWAWAWDVSQAIKLTRVRAPTGVIDVRRQFLAWQNAGAPDQDLYREQALAANINTSIPGIMIGLAADGHRGTLLIDGWHRLYRAYHDGLDALPVHVLSANEATQIQLPGCPWDLITYWTP